MSDMSDLKEKARDTKTDIKDAWRRADGESPADDLATATDRVKDKVADAGDEMHEEADRVSRDVAYEEGRADEMSRSR
jgi:gas vesicle protein